MAHHRHHRRDSRSRSRSPSRSHRRRRSHSRSRSRERERDGEGRHQQYRRHDEGRERDRRRSQEARGALGRTGIPADLADFWSHRREERQRIAEQGVPSVWGRSPTHDVSLVTEARKEASDEKKRKKKHKKMEKGYKKHKKEKKRRSKQASSVSSGAEAEAEGLEGMELIDETRLDEEERAFLQELRAKQEVRRRLETRDSEGEEVSEELGPLPKAQVQLQARDYGKALLPGEGAAMAAFIAEGKRIPRRGEIGLTPDEIVKFEDVGYVMSGSRHRRMEAVRMRKENQLYSADEKRALQLFNKEERAKRESTILTQFRDMLAKRRAARPSQPTPATEEPAPGPSSSSR